MHLRASQQQYYFEKKRALSLFSQQIQTLETRILPRKTKRKLRQMLYVERRSTLAGLQESHEGKTRRIREQTPFNNWNGYLKWKADQGDETTLNVLRSKNQDATIENIDGKIAKDLTEALDKSKASMAQSEKQIAAAGITGKYRSRLLAVTRMEFLKAQEKIDQQNETGRPPIFSGTNHTIDNNGVVIFSLPNGGTIRDTGSKLYFSGDEATERAAALYGLARFGKNIQLRGNSIERKTINEPPSPDQELTSLTLLALNKTIHTVCASCPNSMWFGSVKNQKCFCRIMHAVTWSAEEPNAITHCDGQFLDN